MSVIATHTDDSAAQYGYPGGLVATSRSVVLGMESELQLGLELDGGLFQHDELSPCGHESLLVPLGPRTQGIGGERVHQGFRRGRFMQPAGFSVSLSACRGRLRGLAATSLDQVRL
jgi:hypothetical protein